MILLLFKDSLSITTEIHQEKLGGKKHCHICQVDRSKPVINTFAGRYIVSEIIPINDINVI